MSRLANHWIISAESRRLKGGACFVEVGVVALSLSEEVSQGFSEVAVFCRAEEKAR